MSGDSAAHFETEDGTLCLLLSDGMGCGEAAQRESSMAALCMSSESWAYCDAAFARSSSSSRRYCRRSRNAESSPLTAVRKSGRWMHRSAK